MSKYSFLLIIAVSLFFLGCATKEPLKIDSLEKMFEKEDELIVAALSSLENADYNQSLNIFQELYEKSKKDEYKKEVIALKIKMQRLDEAILEAKEFLESRDNINVKTLLVGALMQKSDFKEALKYSLEILDSSRSQSNLEIVSSIYFGLEDFKSAIMYLESAYAISGSVKVLDRLVSSIYLFEDDATKAISYLETHIASYGCNKNVCEKLAQIYLEKGSIELSVGIYKKMFEKYREEYYKKRIIEIYLGSNMLNEALEFLENSTFDDRVVLEIYKAKGDLERAKDISLNLYNKTDELDFLAQNAIYEYESSKDKNSPSMLKEVVRKLSLVLEEIESDLYENYLGYILIDHDLDYDNGIEYVKRALKKDPNSPYYLDSLAWGYYKLKRCDEAFEVMSRVVDMIGTSESEVRIHWEKIRECFETQNRAKSE